ncbi:MAG: hypothetical protein H5U40_11625 [Polyangiaceae bacterium]|nr:hypothetical protein [Polyangiaceae bacterium]
MRSRRVAVGTDAVALSITKGSAELLVVAEDALGRRVELESAAQRVGLQRVVFGTKISLGQIVGRGDVGVLSVLDEGIAAELARVAEQVTALSEDE